MADGTITSFFEGKLAIRPDFNPNKYKTSVPETETTIVWGKPGADPFEELYVLSAEAEEEREIRRKFDVVRVKDPDNEDNHIDVEVMTEWEGRTTVSNKRVKMTLEKPQASSNVEIRERNRTRSSGG